MLQRFGERFQSSLASGRAAALCETCAALDIREMMREGVPEDNKVHLGALSDIMAKSGRCALCRLVSSLVRRRWRLDDYPGRNVQRINCSLSAASYGTLIPGLEEKRRCYRLHVHANRPHDISTNLIAAKAVLYLDIQLLHEDSYKLSRAKDLHGRRIKDKVDMDLVKKWIRICETEHGEQCESVWWRSGEENLPSFMRVLDVKQMALVPAPPSCRYAALSYVWGGSGESYRTTVANIAPRKGTGGIDESLLPATIRDAVRVTRKTGERYLWIDALCIIQDSVDDKDLQIGIMDLIYSRAAFTIFAAGGEDARSGLPGVSAGSCRSYNQHIERVQGLHLAIPLPPLMEAVAESIWNTRGWTFQEIMLSRRRLFFTKHQVYFECAKDVWCEDVVAESKTLRFSSHPMRTAGTNLFLPDGSQTPHMRLRSWGDAVDRYSQRRLTVESDIMAAIRALMNAMTKGYEPAGRDPLKAFRFGIWVRHLDLCLLWQPKVDASHVRRTLTDGEDWRWPSWAWTGWKGEVRYPVEAYFLDGVESDIHPLPDESLVMDWHIVDENGTIMQLEVERILPSWSFNENPQVPKPKRYAPPAASHARDLEPGFLLPVGTLIFRTQSAYFRVSPVEDAPREDKASTCAIFHILSADPASLGYAGRIILPASTAPLTLIEFIVLSRCEGIRGLWDEVAWGERYYPCMLHVMAVQHASQDHRVRERVGIGVVVEAAWLASRAQESVVLLA